VLTRTLLLCGVFLAFHPMVAQQQKRAIDDAYRNRTVDTICTLLKEKYVLTDRAAESAEALRLINRAGAYDSLGDPARFAERLTGDLQRVTGDRHNRVRLIEPSDIGERAESPLHHPVRLFRLQQKEHSGFSRLEWLEERIGYLEIRRFYPPAVARELLTGAMKFLSGASAIIIDLRENEGGTTDLLPLLSGYFLTYPTQLNSTYYRASDYLQESWIVRDLEGKRLTDVPLFLLTGRKTFSAAESFAYDMKARKRGMIVGDSTKGGAHSVDLFVLDDLLEMYLSTARDVNPVTGANWEGTGVVPDVLVPEACALDTALTLARKAAEQYGKARETRLRLAVDSMQGGMSRTESLFRAGKKVIGEAALDSVVRIGERAGLINEFFLDILAYNYLAERDEEIYYAILRKSAELFPRSAAAYESLAYAYFARGRKAEAIEYAKKALERDPDNRNAAHMIEQLQE
jgi:tetratricopeptide (TPR) repeat protein